MTGEKRKNEPPLYLEMDPDEALERFLGADPKEVEKLTKKGKKKVPSEAEAPDGDSGSSSSQHHAEKPDDS